MIFTVLLSSTNPALDPVRLARMEMEAFPPNGMALVLRNKRYDISDVEACLIPDGEDEPHRVEYKVYVREQLSRTSVAKSMDDAQAVGVTSGDTLALDLDSCFRIRAHVDSSNNTQL